ncbi:hypothetical protein ASG33_02530 [Dyadobacter sp. Leaf189]|nr:hypothetical protein ASG33_02530 [Dyadobacter sp. Leaf189]
MINLVEISGFFTDINLNQAELWHSRQFGGLYLVDLVDGRIKDGVMTMLFRPQSDPDRFEQVFWRLFEFIPRIVKLQGTMKDLLFLLLVSSSAGESRLPVVSSGVNFVLLTLSRYSHLSLSPFEGGVFMLVL